MKHSCYTLVIFVLLIVNSCRETSLEIIVNTDGYWESVGYGRILKVTNGSFKLYDKTNISCVKIIEGELSEFGNALKITPDTLALEDGINWYFYTRLREIPTICTQEVSESKNKDPEYNFEVVAETFKNEYAYFELRNVDWKEMYSRYRPMVTSKTTDAELYRILEDMLDEFNDGHIGLEAPETIEEAATMLVTSDEIKEEPTPKKRYRNHQVSNMIAEKYLENMKSRANKMLQWGTINDTIGYLQINQMFGFANYNLPDSLAGRDYWRAYFDKVETTENHTADEVAGVASIMKAVMEDLKSTTTMILDVRFNGGGKDEAALEIIKYFNDTERVVFSKKARMGATFTQPIPITLESVTHAYTKPVYLLTAHESASATEIMVLSSLLLEHVTKVGSNTEGVFSDVLDKLLPNGWELDLSNEVYLDTKGNNYEGIGIPADIKIEYAMNTQTFLSKIVNDLETRGDEAVEIVLKAN